MHSSRGSSSLRASSGSRSASSSMEPFRSAKSTVTCLRSPSRAAREVRIFSARCLGMYDSALAKRPAGSVVSPAPQDRQNFLPGVTGVPQLGQAASSRAPQSSQKRAPASLSAEHRGHFMPESPSNLAVKIPTLGREYLPGSRVVKDAAAAAAESVSLV